MFSLTITEAAAQLIRREVERSGIKKPAVHLVEARAGIPTARELDEMRVTDEVRRAIADLRSDAPNVERGPWKLVPCVYSRMHFLGLFLVEISGIVFFFPPRLRKRVHGGTLDLGRGALMILDGEGRVLLPRKHVESDV